MYDLTAEEVARLRARPFPIQRTRQRPNRNASELAVESVPWHLADRAWLEYARRYGRGQSAERLAERGGFSEGELDLFCPGWREAAEATAREVLTQVQVLVAHPDPVEALAAIQRALEGWR